MTHILVHVLYDILPFSCAGTALSECCPSAPPRQDRRHSLYVDLHFRLPGMSRDEDLPDTTSARMQPGRLVSADLRGFSHDAVFQLDGVIKTMQCDTDATEVSPLVEVLLFLLPSSCSACVASKMYEAHQRKYDHPARNSHSGTRGLSFGIFFSSPGLCKRDAGAAQASHLCYERSGSL